MDNPAIFDIYDYIQTLNKKLDDYSDDFYSSIGHHIKDINKGGLKKLQLDSIPLYFYNDLHNMFYQLRDEADRMIRSNGKPNLKELKNDIKLYNDIIGLIKKSNKSKTYTLSPAKLELEYDKIKKWESIIKDKIIEIEIPSSFINQRLDLLEKLTPKKIRQHNNAIILSMVWEKIYPVYLFLATKGNVEIQASDVDYSISLIEKPKDFNSFGYLYPENKEKIKELYKQLKGGIHTQILDINFLDEEVTKEQFVEAFVSDNNTTVEIRFVCDGAYFASLFQKLKSSKLFSKLGYDNIGASRRFINSNGKRITNDDISSALLYRNKMASNELKELQEFLEKIIESAESK